MLVFPIRKMYNKESAGLNQCLYIIQEGHIMKKKQVLCVFLAGAMMVSLAACGSSSSSSSKSASGSSGGSSDSSDTLIVGTEAGFAPYEYMSGDEVVGVDMDISKAIADDMGKKLVIKNMDFDGALVAVQSGKVDMVAAGVSVSDERKEVMDFSHEYVDSTEVVVVNASSPHVTAAGSELAGTDLDGKIVAVQQGNIADSWVSSGDNCKPSDIKRYTKFAQAAEDLKNNKVDCIVMDQYPAQELVTSNPELKVMDGVLFEDKYAIAVKKGNEELLTEINKVIDKLKADGKIDEFISNHASSASDSSSK